MSGTVSLMRVFLALLGCAVSLCAAGGRRYPVPQEVGHILAMVQDTQGYVWVGAEGGLFRFDGYRFQPVGEWAGLPREPVKVVVYAHNDGALWMGLPSGLYRLGGARAERVDERPVTDAAWLASGLIAATPGVGLVYWYAEQRQWKRVVESVSPVPAHVHPTPAFDGVTYAQGPALQRATWTGSSLHLTTEPVAGAAGEWREALLRDDHLLLGSATEYAIAKRRKGVWTLLSRHAATATGKRMMTVENVPVSIRGDTLVFFRNGTQSARQIMMPSVVQGLRLGLYAAYLGDSRELLHYAPFTSSVPFGPDLGVREPEAVRLTGRQGTHRRCSNRRQRADLGTEPRDGSGTAGPRAGRCGAIGVAGRHAAVGSAASGQKPVMGSSVRRKQARNAGTPAERKSAIGAGSARHADRDLALRTLHYPLTPCRVTDTRARPAASRTLRTAFVGCAADPLVPGAAEPWSRRAAWFT